MKPPLFARPKLAGFLLATVSLALPALMAATCARAAPPSQTTPLAEEQLFISPSGKPYRSTAGQPYPVVQWFAQADTDHDGKLDKAEFRADAEAWFHLIDIDKDGLIEDHEIAVYEKVLAPEINTDASANVPDLTKIDATRLQGAAPYGLINDAEPIRSADQSFIGRVTLKAFLARADHNFDTLDQHGRGYLSLEDLPRTPVQEAARPAKAARKK